MDTRSPREKYQDYLVDTKQKSQQAYDDGVLKVCGGSLGVSVAIAGSLIENPAWVLLLVLAWGCWVAALIVVIASHHYSVRAADEALVGTRGSRIVTPDNRPLVAASSRANRIVKRLNPFGWPLFALGAILLGAFVALNVGGVPMAKNDPRTGTRTGTKTGTDSARPQPGTGSQADERGHTIEPPPAGVTHSGQDSGPTRTPGKGTDRGGARNKP